MKMDIAASLPNPRILTWNEAAAMANSFLCELVSQSQRIPGLAAWVPTLTVFIPPNKSADTAGKLNGIHFPIAKHQLFRNWWIDSEVLWILRNVQYSQVLHLSLKGQIILANWHGILRWTHGQLSATEIFTASNISHNFVILRNILRTRHIYTQDM